MEMKLVGGWADLKADWMEEPRVVQMAALMVVVKAGQMAGAKGD